MLLAPVNSIRMADGRVRYHDGALRSICGSFLLFDVFCDFGELQENLLRFLLHSLLSRTTSMTETDFENGNSSLL